MEGKKQIIFTRACYYPIGHMLNYIPLKKCWGTIALYFYNTICYYLTAMYRRPTFTKKLFSLLLVCYIGCAYSQNATLDSLRQIIKSEAADSIKFDAYNRLLFGLSRIASNEALTLSDEMMDFAIAKDNYAQQIVAHYNKAVIHRNKGQYELALPHIEKYLEYRASIKDTIGLGHGTYQLALLHRLRGEYELSMNAYNQNIIFKKHLKDSVGLSMAYNGKGVLYRRLGQFDLALKEYNLAVQINQSINRLKGVGACYTNIGNVYAEMGDHLKGLEYHQKHMDITIQQNNKYGQGVAHENIGNMNRELGNYTIAMDHYRQSLEIREQLGHQRYIMSIKRQIATLLMKEKKYNESIEWAEQSLKIATDLRMLEEVGNGHNLLSRIHKSSGNYKKALFHLENYKTNSDSILNSNITAQMNEMDALFQNKEKEEQILLLNHDAVIRNMTLSRQRIGLIGGGLILSLISVLYWLNRKKNKIIAKALKEKDVLLREIHHRVKNNLQVISSLLGLQTRNIKDEIAKSALRDSRSRVHAMSLIHQNLYKKEDVSSVNAATYIDKLLLHLQDTYGNSSSINLESEIEDFNLDVETLVPIGLIINELVSNSYKYAFDNGGTIRVDLNHTGEQLALSVSDNGKGIDDLDTIVSSNSYGYELVHALVDQLDATIDIQSNQGTQVSIFINNYGEINNESK